MNSENKRGDGEDQKLANASFPEFVEEHAEGGVLSEDDFSAYIQAIFKKELTAATEASASVGDDTDHQDGYGTGVENGGSGVRKPPAEIRELIAENMQQSSDPKDYSTGVHDEPSRRKADRMDRSKELTGAADAPGQSKTSAGIMANRNDLSSEVYNTGIEGDTRGSDYRQRQREVETMADAFELVIERSADTDGEIEE